MLDRLPNMNSARTATTTTRDQQPITRRGRVSSGKFRHQVNSDTHLQTVEIQIRRIFIRIFTVCFVNLIFIPIIQTWKKQGRCPNLDDCPNLPDFTLELPEHKYILQEIYTHIKDICGQFPCESFLRRLTRNNLSILDVRLLRAADNLPSEPSG